MSRSITLSRIFASTESTATSNATLKLAKYELRDVMRSRWILLYGLFFLGLTEALLRFGGGTTHALISLINVVLLIVPLVGIVFGTMYLYSAREFVELLLSQPVNRRQLYVGLYVGLVGPLTAAFLVGTAVPFLARGLTAGDLSAFLSLLGAGTFLTLIFVGFAFPISIGSDERVRGLGLALATWLGLSVVYDGFVLFILQAAANYPLEGAALVMTMLNPVDLARSLLLLQFDVAALMGYTGAVFEQFFGSAFGTATALAVLVVWTALPFGIGMARFRKKDF
ncbi:MAG: ABC transporter permease subunit [Rhodothermales bacterium]